jgi:hypothetical protein
MRFAIFSHNAAAVKGEDYGQARETDIMQHLVKGAL